MSKKKKGPGVKMIDDRVLVERSDADKAKGKILLPDDAQEDKREGTVVGVGPGRIGHRIVLTNFTSGPAGEIPGAVDVDSFRLPMAVKVGDKVIWGAYAELQGPMGPMRQAVGFPLGEDLVIVGEPSILGVIED